MRRMMRGWRGWALLGVGLVMLGAVLVSVFAGEEDQSFTATPYADVVRFKATGVASLQVGIYDLSGQELWASGVRTGQIVDWERTNAWGERLAYGVYLYSAQGWDAQGGVVLEKSGKLAFLPGDQVQLQVAPSVASPESSDGLAPSDGESITLQPMGLGDTGIFGTVGIGTASPASPLHVLSTDSYGMQLEFSGTPIGRFNINHPSNTGFRLCKLAGANPEQAFSFAVFESGGTNLFTIWDDTAHKGCMFIEGGTGNVGIGTSLITAKLTIEDSSGQDLIAAYNSSNRVFVVKSDGEVCADGAYYGAGFHTGGADVAERINTSEWVEAGNVVEIDPDHPGFFRKSRTPYSTKVAGIISTSPGVILGNNFEENIDKWEDNRPVLAIAGRVPVKATTENGPIQIGDLLVSSSAPGVAMRGTDREGCIGAVVGKAMEPLETGTGTIMVQVMLR